MYYMHILYIHKTTRRVGPFARARRGSTWLRIGKTSPDTPMELGAVRSPWIPANIGEIIAGLSALVNRFFARAH